MNDDDFEEFKKLLKRVRGDFLKLQHCYTTAIKLPPENADQAIKLINYGLDNFEDSWYSTYRSYCCLGHIYEVIGDYHNAYNSYLLAQNTLGNEQQSYLESVSLDLLWMRLHIDNFQYSTEIENFYLCASNAGKFALALVNNEYRMIIAKIIIELHYGKNIEAKQAYERAIEICQPDFIGKAQDILNKHHYNDQLKATPESLKYLAEIQL